MVSWLVRLVLFRPLSMILALLWPPLPRRRDAVLRLRISGRLVEAAPRLPPFMPAQAASVGELTALLRAASRERRIAGVHIDLGHVEAGVGRIQELRRALQALREAGKYVHVNLVSGGLREYLLACAADEITMPPAATLDVVGLRAEVTYLGGLIAALGIHPDFEAVGDYKSFAERFVRTGPTDAARHNTEEIFADLWDQVISAVAAGRGLDRERAEDLLGRGPFGAGEAVAEGLIDAEVYPDRVPRRLRDTLGKVKTVKAARYWGRRRRVDRWRWRARRTPVVAVIPAVGQILAGAPGGASQGNVITARSINRMLNAVRKEPDVAAVVLRIDSPGGSAEASDLIWRQVVRLAKEKPVVASMGDVAASGGYYIAMGADHVIAQPGTLTGSIGVVAGKINLSGLFERLGIHHEVVSYGDNAGFYSTSGDFSDSERARLRARMADFYRIFVGKAAQCRELGEDDLEQHARGRVWTGRQALQRGLVDGLGGFHDAVSVASGLAGHDSPLVAVTLQAADAPWWSPLRWMTSLRLASRFPTLSWLAQPELRRGGLLARLPFDFRIG